MEVYEGEKIVQGYVIGQEMQEAVVVPQAAASAPVVPIPMERGQWHGQTHFEGRISAYSLRGVWCGWALMVFSVGEGSSTVMLLLSPATSLRVLPPAARSEMCYAHTDEITAFSIFRFQALSKLLICQWKYQQFENQRF